MAELLPAPAIGKLPAWHDVMVPNYGTPQVTLVKGFGSTVVDAEGRAYTDLLAGIATTILGHGNAAIRDAVCKQAGELVHVSNLYAHPQALRLAARLSKQTYGHRALFVNSGTEANEAALKAMRLYAHGSDRKEAVVLACEGSFHGRTAGSLALTGQPRHKVGCGPVPGGVVHVPFNDPGALERAFAKHDVVGMFVECIQGEGGVIPMEPEYAAAVRSSCREAAALLCVDEVQTGMGRTGTFHAHSRLGLQPDLVTMAKGLGGGLPIGCMLASPSVADYLQPGTHGCTFGGNPVSVAAANAVLDELEKGNLVAGVAARGRILGEALDAHNQPPRGAGLLWGIPHANASEVVQAARASGILVGQAGGETVRLSPALNIPEDQLADACRALMLAI